MAENLLFEFKVEAKVGGFLVTCPETTKEDGQLTGYVCTSREGVVRLLDSWLAWVDRDEKGEDAVEAAMRKNKVSSPKGDDATAT